jgi:PIN domain nuclease of toxin-antitoxin system
MDYLVDTQIIYWWMTDDDRLPSSIRKIIEKSPIWMSVVTPWEMLTKEQKGKLKIPGNFEHGLRSTGFVRLDVDLNHVIEYRRLPRLHADPFDRMLIAQARVEGLTLITADKRFTAYDVAVKLVQP